MAIVRHATLSFSNSDEAEKFWNKLSDTKIDENIQKVKQSGIKIDVMMNSNESDNKSDKK